MTRLHYDAVIIGGGHNGLVCAAYLARSGLRTVVLERRPLVGGAAVTEEVWPGYRVSVASYVVSLLPPGIVRDLDLVQHGYHVDPLDPAYFAPLLDGRGVLLWDDPRRAAAEIARVSPRDGEAYLAYSRTLDELADMVRPLLHTVPPPVEPRSLADVSGALSFGRHLLRRRRALPRLVELMTLSVADFLAQFFEDDAVMGILAPGGVIGVWGGPMSPGSAYVLLHHRIGQVGGARGAWGFVRGGMGALSDAIATSARAAGAEVRTDAEVAAVDVVAGRARGVVLGDGTELAADAVVSTVHPTTTFLGLVGRSHLPEELARDIERYRTRGPAAKVNLALSGLPDYTVVPGTQPGPQHPELIVSPSLTYLERAWDEVKYGRFSARPMIDAVIPTTKDPGLAPDGRHIMSCFVQYVPYEPSGTEATADGADRGWDAAGRDALATTVIDTVADFAPGFGDLVEHVQVLTPFDLEERFGLVGGNIFQGEMAVDQLFSLRPAPGAAGYRTPVARLYLGGSGAHPGGGVMGIPGYNAARVVLGDLRRRRAGR